VHICSGKTREQPQLDLNQKKPDSDVQMNVEDGNVGPAMEEQIPLSKQDEEMQDGLTETTKKAVVEEPVQQADTEPQKESGVVADGDAENEICSICQLEYPLKGKDAWDYATMELQGEQLRNE